jgi:hypothetical protein
VYGIGVTAKCWVDCMDISGKVLGG